MHCKEKKCVRKEYFDILEQLNPYDVLVINAAMDPKYQHTILGAESTKLDHSAEFDPNMKIFQFLKEECNLGLPNIQMSISTEYLKKLGLLTEQSDPPVWNLTLLGFGLAHGLRNS